MGSIVMISSWVLGVKSSGPAKEMLEVGERGPGDSVMGYYIVRMLALRLRCFSHS
jgi:hypothetical protein